ncbi:LytR/AlgR family response regulator transcription factor [Alkalicoccus halolimnae]|uniref:LytTR family DNA-binding domain-containing protein n=1 Tax=Alkalicoccus halolimnae TaxID=1667239 RepID=A0A5C7F5Z7_9BACI|nr:LytTR family DNA-binding domain-containing protein [Alkalicoccus halolimnae]TXF86141.1 response regulator transcription factor [Alkalicoccus halolimnae]
MMKKRKVIIAEDDTNSSEILQEFLKKAADFEIVGVVENGEELIELNFNLKPDVALVDIGLPVLDGMKAVKECIKTNPSLQYIFTTAYEEFAVEAFDISAVDYIVKPIKKIRLYEALEKIKPSISSEKSPAESSVSKNKKLIVKTSTALQVIDTDTIVFIEKMNRKTFIHTRETTYESNETLENYSKMLKDNFFSSHRSFLINLNFVSQIISDGETYFIYFQDFSKYAHVSKLKYLELVERLKQ